MSRRLGDFEQIVLFAVVRLGDRAYGVSIQREIAGRTGRNVVIGAVYTTLHRLEARGLVTARMGKPRPERGGRRRRYYSVEPAGARILSETFESLQRMADGTGSRLAELMEAGHV
jgi:DNA-binding PadR family transcriptional regulator